MNDPDGDLTCLFETIINTIKAPNCDEEGPAQMLVSNIDYDDYKEDCRRNGCDPKDCVLL